MDAILNAILGLGSTFLSTAGLSLDAVGVVLLYCFGLPSRVRPPESHGKALWAWGGQSSPEGRKEAKKYRRFKCGSGLGVVLLLVGFGLQIAANYAPVP